MTYKTQRVFGDGIRGRISYMKNSTNFLHEKLDSFTVCILPRWNLFIHTVSPKLAIIDLTDGLLIQCLG